MIYSISFKIFVTTWCRCDPHVCVQCFLAAWLLRLPWNKELLTQPSLQTACRFDHCGVTVWAMRFRTHNDVDTPNQTLFIANHFDQTQTNQMANMNWGNRHQTQHVSFYPQCHPFDCSYLKREFPQIGNFKRLHLGMGWQLQLTKRSCLSHDDGSLRAMQHEFDWIYCEIVSLVS